LPSNKLGRWDRDCLSWDVDEMRVGTSIAVLMISTQTICWAETVSPGTRFIRFDTPSLAPMAFVQFCRRYADECEPQRLVFRGGRLKLTNQRLAELESINRTVNSSIRPELNKKGAADAEWLLGPVHGDCTAYAVTKRHQLITKGWPARTVLLSEVVTISGEHHLVTVVRTSRGDLVLDNLTDQIMPWFHKPYEWLRIQTPKDPNNWAAISNQNTMPPVTNHPA
jgi:predicted transglutaminase-like cysteine proteinase